MHFDHVVGLADFWLTSSLWQKKTNTNIYGPKGIKKFCSQIKKLYEKDLEYRYEISTLKNFKDFAFIYLQISSLVLLAAKSSFFVGVSTP